MLSILLVLACLQCHDNLPLTVLGTAYLPDLIGKLDMSFVPVASTEKV